MSGKRRDKPLSTLAINQYKLKSIDIGLGSMHELNYPAIPSPGTYDVFDMLGKNESEWCDVITWGIKIIGNTKCLSFLDAKRASVRSIPITSHWEFV